MKSNNVKAMFLAYLASRFDYKFLPDLGCNTFTKFSSYIAKQVGVNKNSVKNWRDEFDGLNPEPTRLRKGRTRDRLRPTRVYMKMQFDSCSYEQLYPLAKSVLGQSNEISTAFINELFEWANTGNNHDTQVVIEAIETGLLSFSESQDIKAIEGGRRLVTHLRIERKQGIAKEAVLRHVRDSGPVCTLCVLDFSRRYNLGMGDHCLEAHHKMPLSIRPAESETNLEDFMIVCPSCHRVIHKKRAFDIDSLGMLLKRSQ